MAFSIGWYIWHGIILYRICYWQYPPSASSSACMILHDDVIKWKHFPRYWPFVRGIHRSPANSPHKGKLRAALMFSLICAWINVWVNNREAGDLRRYRAHYDVIVMEQKLHGRFLVHGERPSPSLDSSLNTLRPRQNGRLFADVILKCIFLNEKVWISIKISLKFVPKRLIYNIPALVQIMAWRRPGDKPLSEAMMVSLLTHKCVARPQWVKMP